MDNTEEAKVEIVRPVRVKKGNNKKADLNTKIGKFFVARKKGKTQREAATIAGYPPATVNVAYRIEKTKTFQELEKVYYKDELLKKISLEQIAAAHADNIMQDTDRGARNKAIEMAMDKLEPNKIQEAEDRVYVILKDEDKPQALP